MKKKTLIIFLIIGIFTLGAFASLSILFQQEAPKNTIRILIDKPIDEHHLRLKPLLSENKYSYHSESEGFELIPLDSKKPTLQFKIVKDETTRALIFLKNGADVLYNSLSIAKTEWLKNQNISQNAHVYSSAGDTISELAMNDESLKLQNPEIIKSIIEALPVRLWSKSVFFNWVDPVNSEQIEVKPLTDKIVLHYLSTNSREGQQMAFLVREALKKINIDVDVHLYEPSLFYTKIKKREFDLYSSRRSEGVSSVLDLPHTITTPLFRWRHGLIINHRIIVPKSIESKLDYSFRFLEELKLQSSL